MTPLTLPFAGPDVEAQDAVRFGTQLWGVRKVMSDGNWRTIKDLDRALRVIGIYATHEAIKERLWVELRELGFKVERRKVRPNLSEYRLLPEEAKLR